MKSFIVNKIIGLIILACVVFFPFQAYAASAHGHIRAALATLDKIKALSEEAVADPQDEEEVEGKRRLQYLKGFFFNGNLPYEAKTKAFVSGAVLPDILNMIVGWAGKFPHYGDTSFFYTLLVAEGAKPDSNGNVNEENVAFALGALTHYMADKFTHPIVNEFSGNVYGENANHSVVKWDYNTGKALRDVDGNPQLFLSDGGENKELHVFLECWLSKDILNGVSYNNPTLLLANELKYYDFDDTFRVSASQINLVINTYKKLWNAGGMGPFGISQFNITTFDDKMGEFINSVTKAHSQGVQLERSFVQWALTDLPPIVLPTAADSANFQDELIKIGELNGVNYSSITLRFLDALYEQSPKEAIEILKRITPFMEDKVLENITVNDTRLQNINLDNGQVSTYKNNNDHHVPEIYKDVNFDKTKAYIANQAGVTLKSIEIQDSHLSSQPDVTVDSNPQAVVFDPTGRFAWVANKGSNTISWVDTVKNKEIDQNKTDNISFTRLQVGSDPVALAITPDGSKMCVANNGSRTVSIIDVAKRELKNTIPISGGELKDIKIDPQGKYAFVSVQKSGPDNTHPGEIQRIDLQSNAVIILPLQNSENPGGLAISPDGSKLYTVDKGRTNNRPNYFHNFDIATSVDEPVSHRVEGSMPSRLETIDTQFYWCSVLTAPIIIDILVGINIPPSVGVYTFIGGYEDLPSMTGFLVGLPFFGLVWYDLPWMITLTYKTDPLWLRQGVNVDVPAVLKYTNYNTDFLAAYTSFWYTGNIGIYDRNKKEFFAATRSVVGDEWMSRPYNRYGYLKASTIGDIIALDKYKNMAAFYPGKRIFQVLSESSDTLDRKPIDHKSLWEIFRPIVSPGFIGGLNKPTGVDIQPMVYSPMPLIGDTIVSRSENGSQVDYMVFSHKKIKDIKVFDGPIHEPAMDLTVLYSGHIEWAQKHDRFWELIIRNTKDWPFDCAVGSGAKTIGLEFEVTLDNSAVVSIGSSPEVINGIPPPSVNLEIAGVAESKEEIEGGFVMLNDDDDDKDGKPDNDSAQPRPVANEDDLVKLTIHKVEPEAHHQGTVTLKVTAGADKIKIWDTKTKDNEITLPKTYSTPSDLPKELWVEGSALSGTAMDVELVLEYIKDGEIYNDKVKLTVVKVHLDGLKVYDPKLKGAGNSEIKYLIDKGQDYPLLKIELVILKGTAADTEVACLVKKEEASPANNTEVTKSWDGKWGVMADGEDTPYKGLLVDPGELLVQIRLYFDQDAKIPELKKDYKIFVVRLGVQKIAFDGDQELLFHKTTPTSYQNKEFTDNTNFDSDTVWKLKSIDYDKGMGSKPRTEACQEKPPVGETYDDLNNNGNYDSGEPYFDADGDKKWTADLVQANFPGQKPDASDPSKSGGVDEDNWNRPCVYVRDTTIKIKVKLGENAISDLTGNDISANYSVADYPIQICPTYKTQPMKNNGRTFLSNPYNISLVGGPYEFESIDKLADTVGSSIETLKFEYKYNESGESFIDVNGNGVFDNGIDVLNDKDNDGNFDENWKNIPGEQSTTHLIYRLAKTPLPTPVSMEQYGTKYIDRWFMKIVDFTCEWAKGKKTPEEVFKEIWENHFWTTLIGSDSMRHPDNANGFHGKGDSEETTHPDMWINAPKCYSYQHNMGDYNGFDTEWMLDFNQGRCEAWHLFLRAFMRTHGLDAERQTMPPMKWRFVDGTTGAVSFEKYSVAEALKNNNKRSGGANAQEGDTWYVPLGIWVNADGQANPYLTVDPVTGGSPYLRSFWVSSSSGTDHVFIKYNGRYYDGSYEHAGGASHATINEKADAGISKYYYQIKYVFHAATGQFDNESNSMPEIRIWLGSSESSPSGEWTPPKHIQDFPNPPATYDEMEEP